MKRLPLLPIASFLSLGSLGFCGSATPSPGAHAVDGAHEDSHHVTTAAASAQGDVQIQTQPLRGGVHMLVGRGGNLGVSVGDSGTFLIDDQFAPLSGKIQAAIDKLTDRPVSFLINTHMHGDHTGGNENFSKAGAVIVAHENVRRRMNADQMQLALAERTPGSLPVVTFTDSVTFHWNGDEIRVFHVARAHTDGDAIIHFAKADVVHMGDCFFNGNYPFIDVENGGTLRGAVAAAERVLAIADGDTQIIPGHGPLASRADLVVYRDLLQEIYLRLADMAEAGMTVDEIAEARPTEEWDAQWGNGFMNPDRFVRLAAQSVIDER